MLLISSDQTLNEGENIAKTLSSGDIVLLHGDLGAGKTTLVKGIGKGLGITNNITSPSFTLMNIYEVPNSKFGVKRLAHIDTYRLENEQQLVEIGAEDYLGDEKTITIIEWPEKISKLLKNKVVKNFYLSHSEEGRILSEENE